MTSLQNPALPWRKPQPVLHDADFQRFRALILERTGLVFDDKRREVVAQALTEGALQAGLSLDRYYNTLSAQATQGTAWEPLISALTVNESYFFRDPEQMEALQRHVLPDVIARCRSRRRIRLWSAGCSTGEEPYTLAILLHQLIPDLENWDVHILATDIDRQVLQQAARATSRDWSFRSASTAIRQTYFNETGAGFLLHSHLQRLVTFAYLNLAEDTYPTLSHPLVADIDVILCRNVTIYLPEPVIHAIAGRFHQCLAPHSWLMVGASETNDQRYHPFQAVNLGGVTVYKKVERTADSAFGSVDAIVPITMVPEVTKEAAPVWYGAPENPDVPDVAPPYIPPIPQKVVDVTPSSADDCQQLARLAANAGHLPEAQQLIMRALTINPLHVTSHYLLALIQQEQGATAAAVAQFRKVIYLEPDFILAHVHLGDLYQKLGQCAAALRHRTQAYRLSERLPTDAILPGSDDLTAGYVLALLHNVCKP